MTYTKPPWNVGIGKTPVISCGDTLKPIATLAAHDDPVNKLSNLKLIGKAPELFEALVKARDYVYEYSLRFNCPETDKYLNELDLLLSKFKTDQTKKTKG